MHESYGYICFIAVFHFPGRNYPIYVYIEKIKRLKTVLLHCELIMVALQFVVIVTIYRILYRIYIYIYIYIYRISEARPVVKKFLTSIQQTYQTELFSNHSFVTRFKTHLRIF